MSKLYLGSIDLTKINKDDIVTTDKNGNPFQNGAKYLNVAIWANDQPDQYGNSISIKAGKKNSSYYIGNAKIYNKDSAPTESAPEESAPDKDDLPF